MTTCRAIFLCGLLVGVGAQCDAATGADAGGQAACQAEQQKEYLHLLQSSFKIAAPGDVEDAAGLLQEVQQTQAMAQELLQQTQPLQALQQPYQVVAQELLQQQAQASLSLLEESQGATTDELEQVTVQDVMGLVGTMGEQQRKHKHIQNELFKAQQHEKELKNMVLTETNRYKMLDQTARSLAIQAQKSISTEQATVDNLKQKVTELNKELDHSKKHLEDDERDLATSQEKQKMALLAQQGSEKRAADAEVRARNALKAGELEDLALKQQETYLEKLMQEMQAEASKNDPIPATHASNRHHNHHHSR